MIKTSEQIETDKLLLSCTGLWEEFRINKTKDPINVQEYYNLISNLLDQQLNHSRIWLSSPHAKEYYYAEMQRQKEILQSLDMEWDDLLEQTYESVDDLIERVYVLGKQKGYNDIKEKLVFTDTDKEALDFVRQYNFHLIKKLSDDLRSSVKNNITQAVATGENPYSLANKIAELGVKPLEGSTLSAKQRAVMIAKTEVSRAQNTGILQSYVNEGYTEVTILTAEDSNVCSLCLDNAYLFNKSEDKVYHPGLKDNVHRISDLDEDSMLPLHPNCRCTYLSVWDSRDTDVEPYIVNLTPFHDLSKLNNTSPQKTDKPLNIPEAVADYYDLDFEEKDGVFYFHDKTYNCTITFPKNYVDKKGKYKEYIDMTSSGKGKYDLKEIMDIYTTVPPILKHATNNIKFNNRKGRKNVLGFATVFTEEGKKIITINPLSLEQNKHIRGNFQQTLYHEMGHCLSMSMMDKEFANLLNKYVTAGKFVEGTPIKIRGEINRKLKQGYTFGISRTDEFKSVVSKNTQYQKENNLPVEKASAYGAKSYEEDWAEICSMASVHDADKETLNRAVLQNYDLKHVKYDEWVKNNKVVYEWAVEKLVSINRKDFNY